MSAADFSFANIRSSVPGVAWPPLSTGPAATLVALLRQFDDSQWLDPAAIRANQFRQLRALADHSAEHSPHFARRLVAAGLTPESLATDAGFARLAPLRRHEVQRVADLFCDQLPPDHGPLFEARTSGSTGEPVVVRRTAIGKLMWLAHMVREQLWHRRDLSGRHCAIRANVDTLVRLPQWSSVVGNLVETGEALLIPITMPIDEQIAMIDDFRPDNLLAYPNVIAALLQDCRARGRGFAGLNHLRAIGETLSDDLRRDAAAFFGAKVTDCYSSQEIGYLTLECPDAPGHHHVMAETVIVELLRDDGTPCEVGEMGRVIVTDLHNFATPMIRYDIGDFAEAGPPCACGRGLPVLRRVVGRECHRLQFADGQHHWPWLGRHNFQDVAPVRQFQVIQRSFERVELCLVCERALTIKEEADLRVMTVKMLGHDFAVDLRYFEGRLPTAANGKFDEFIRRLE